MWGWHVWARARIDVVGGLHKKPRALMYVRHLPEHMVSMLPSVSGRVVEEGSSMDRTIYGSRPKLAKRSPER